MADNKVVIKINYANNRPAGKNNAPKMITVWHTRRIVFAVSLLLILIAAFYGCLSDRKDAVDSTPSAIVEPVKPEQVVEAPLPAEPAKKPSVKAEEAIHTEPLQVVKRPAAIILDKRVVRAALTSVPKHDEPGEPVSSPLIIDSGLSRELFYFVQIKNMKGRILFHHWNKDGRLVIKKQFSVKTNNDRLISSRKLTAIDSGQWQVVLKDGKGRLFSEVNYSVNP